MTPIDYSQVTETSPHCFVIEASDLGLQGWPQQIKTSMGNGQPFIRSTKKVDADGDVMHVRYNQDLGCLTLVILND